MKFLRIALFGMGLWLLAACTGSAAEVPTLDEFEWQLGEYSDDYILVGEPLENRVESDVELPLLQAQIFEHSGPVSVRNQRYARVGDRRLPLTLSLTVSEYEQEEGASYIVSDEYREVVVQLQNEYSRIELVPNIAELESDHIAYRIVEGRAGFFMSYENLILSFRAEPFEGGIHPMLIELAQQQIAWLEAFTR